ncbi:methyltransferase domain-containing protein [Chloroflexota bacterium]
MHLAWFLVLGICFGGWQLAVWLGEIRSKNKRYEVARACALERDKPLLVAGGPWGSKRARHLLKMPAHGNGDVCLDINRDAMAGHTNAVIANVTHVPFSDKSFGAAFASHLLEHLPNTDDAERALAELNRVAEAVFVVCPSRQSIANWVIPDHHLWIWQEGNTICFRQRGKLRSKNKA